MDRNKLKIQYPIVSLATTILTKKHAYGNEVARFYFPYHFYSTLMRQFITNFDLRDFNLKTN